MMVGCLLLAGLEPTKAQCISAAEWKLETVMGEALAVIIIAT